MYDLKENEFLHDMANHLVVIEGLCGVLFDALVEEELDEKKRERMGKILVTIRKMTTLLRARRETLEQEKIKK